MYELYLFDFDYTLVNSEQGIVGCFRRTIEKWQLPRPADDAIRHTIGLPMEKAVAILTGLTDADDIDRFITDYKRDADIHMTPGTHFFPDTLPTLRALRARGAKIAIISTKTRTRIEEKFVVDHCTDLIDRIIGCEDVTAMKPSPEGIEKAIALFGAKKEAVLLDDFFELFSVFSCSTLSNDINLDLTRIFHFILDLLGNITSHKYHIGI